MQQRSADITTYKLVLSSKLVLSTVLKPAKYQLNAVASCAADWAELAAAGRPSAKRSCSLLRFPYSMNCTPSDSERWLAAIGPTF